MFVTYLKDAMTDGGRRSKIITHPFPLAGYHALFDGVGDQLPPTKVTSDMVFTTFVYQEQFPVLNRRLPAEWRDKPCNRNNPDKFLRVNSIYRPADQPKLRKKRARKNVIKDTNLFTISYRIYAHEIVVKFTYRQYFNAAKHDPSELYLK